MPYGTLSEPAARTRDDDYFPFNIPAHDFSPCWGEAPSSRGFHVRTVPQTVTEYRGVGEHHRNEFVDQLRLAGSVFLALRLIK